MDLDSYDRNSEYLLLKWKFLDKWESVADLIRAGVHIVHLDSSPPPLQPLKCKGDEGVVSRVYNPKICNFYVIFDFLRFYYLSLSKFDFPKPSL